MSRLAALRRDAGTDGARRNRHHRRSAATGVRTVALSELPGDRVADQRHHSGDGRAPGRRPQPASVRVGLYRRDTAIQAMSRSCAWPSAARFRVRESSMLPAHDLRQSDAGIEGRHVRRDRGPRFAGTADGRLRQRAISPPHDRGADAPVADPAGTFAVKSMTISLTVNGALRECEVASSTVLADVLRDTLGLQGCKIACDQGVCGACTVLVDGNPVAACSSFAFASDGCAITTVEGLKQNGVLHAVQSSFLDNSAFQCGFCTSGMILSIVALLRAHPDPDDDNHSRLARRQCLPMYRLWRHCRSGPQCNPRACFGACVMHGIRGQRTEPRRTSIEGERESHRKRRSIPGTLSFPRLLHGKLLRSPLAACPHSAVSIRPLRWRCRASSAL